MQLLPLTHFINNWLGDGTLFTASTVQGHRLVERKFQWSLFAEFLQAKFFLLKIRSWLPIKIHEFKKAMVKKYFQNSNLLLNKLLHWNKVSPKCSVVKCGGHSLVQHVCSIENYRLIRPKLTTHVAPMYVPTPIKTWKTLTHCPITCQWMENSGILYYGKVLSIIISWIHAFENIQ